MTIFEYFAGFITSVIAWAIGQVGVFVTGFGTGNWGSNAGAEACIGVNSVFNVGIVGNDSPTGWINHTIVFVHSAMRSVSWFFPVQLFFGAITLIIATELLIYGVKVVLWIIHAVTLKFVPKV
jgi:hypothetical protein